MIVDHALEERRTPGNTLIVQPDKPYQVPARSLPVEIGSNRWWLGRQHARRAGRHALPGAGMLSAVEG